MNLDDVVRHAESLGLSVIEQRLDGLTGELRTGNRILIDPTKSLMTQRVAVAHECGHALHGHDWRGRHSRSRDERQANQYAAELLIQREAVIEISRIHADDRSIARELGVPVVLLRLWAETHRLGA